MNTLIFVLLFSITIALFYVLAQIRQIDREMQVRAQQFGWRRLHNKNSKSKNEQDDDPPFDT